ncbi:hypothetical protein [Pseudophaeobacter flagellatus]|uniref:hypothetical protein n=1 Tax=Pseudophaeobacter flagellatus TaxID=2899119 RepID=UPI001E3B709C|nr:hypothetical protein [Pseudophaeobacter flagellatus]MCD9147467.1 hypothetical protein [Pseudophaeobacter flagellatus]
MKRFVKHQKDDAADAKAIHEAAASLSGARDHGIPSYFAQVYEDSLASSLGLRSSYLTA